MHRLAVVDDQGSAETGKEELGGSRRGDFHQVRGGPRISAGRYPLQDYGNMTRCSDLCHNLGPSYDTRREVWKTQSSCSDYISPKVYQSSTKLNIDHELRLGTCGGLIARNTLTIPACVSASANYCMVKDINGNGMTAYARRNASKDVSLAGRGMISRTSEYLVHDKVAVIPGAPVDHLTASSSNQRLEAPVAIVAPVS